jgi:PleD family two-component response regulator
VGIAAYEEGMGSYEVLVAAADRALYAAKQAGRNQVSVAERSSKPAAPASAKVVLPRPLAQGGTESLLIIDDDLSVLRSVGKLLRRAGYQVEETDDPELAIQRFKEANPPQLLVTDVMMPRMNGLTLADRIATSQPGLRVVYLSGYMQKDVSWAGLPGAAAGFVSKPIEMQELLATTRDVLDRATVAAP